MARLLKCAPIALRKNPIGVCNEQQLPGYLLMPAPALATYPIKQPLIELTALYWQVAVFLVPCQNTLK